MKMRFLSVLLVAAACSSGSSDTTAVVTPGPNQVFMQGSAFNPATRTVTAGTTVQFVNMDGLTHTATSSSVPAGAAVFTSGSLNMNGTFSVNLTVPGTYAYYCVFHGTPGSGMRGTIIVN
jgi:plastocyanin